MVGQSKAAGLLYPEDIGGKYVYRNVCNWNPTEGHS